MLKFHPLRVAELRVEPEEAVYVSFIVPPELRADYRFEAGQHIGIRTMLDGEELRRTYSLVNAPDDGLLRIAVRTHEHGRMSGHLARKVHVGDTLEVLTPNGSFHSRLPMQQRRTVVAFAAGCGITPTLSIVRTILEGSPRSRLLLFYGNRTTSRIMLLEELQALKDRFVQRLSLQFLFSGEPQDVELFNGRLDAAKVRELSRSLFEAGDVDEYFVCGPGNMNDQVSGLLQELGVAADRIHSERFTVSGAPTVAPVAVAQRAPETKAGSTTSVRNGAGRRNRAGSRRAGRLRSAVLVSRGRVLDMPHEGGEGRGRNGAELRPRAVGSGGGLRARLPITPDDAATRSQLRRTLKEWPAGLCGRLRSTSWPTTISSLRSMRRSRG